jgi:hypothetical protein
LPVVVELVIGMFNAISNAPTTKGHNEKHNAMIVDEAAKPATPTPKFSNPINKYALVVFSFIVVSPFL